jgi:hypothetical protein
VRIVDLNQTNKVNAIADFSYDEKAKKLKIKVQERNYYYQVLYLLKTLNGQLPGKAKITSSDETMTIEAEDFSRLGVAALKSELLTRKNLFCREE